MALITANDIDVIEMASDIPLVGVWGLELIADTEEILNGRVTVSIADGALTYVGTAFPARSGSYILTDHTRVIAGNGGLATVAVPRFYANVTLSIVLQDLLDTAGEVLSSTADQSVLDTELPFWMVIAQPVASALQVLLATVQTQQAQSLSWRMLADGTFWTGYESWTPTTVDYDLLDNNPREARLEIVSNTPTVEPGQTLTLDDGSVHQVQYVEHRITGDRIRQTLWTT